MWGCQADAQRSTFARWVLSSSCQHVAACCAALADSVRGKLGKEGGCLLEPELAIEYSCPAAVSNMKDNAQKWWPTCEVSQHAAGSWPGPVGRPQSSCCRQGPTCEVVPPVHVKVGLLKAFMVAGQGAHHGGPGALEDQVPAARPHTMACGCSTGLLRFRPQGRPRHELINPQLSLQKPLTPVVSLWLASKLDAPQGQPVEHQ